MNISRKTKMKVAAFSVYTVLLIGIAFQLKFYLPDALGLSDKNAEPPYRIHVSGNVLRPGQYLVPPGTTHFEILKVAGVKPTSDLAMFNLTQQISDNQELQVGTMPNPVTIKKEATKIRAEFILGDVSVIAGDGKTRQPEKGMEISMGDRIISDERAQVEMSVGTFSRIDLDNFSELVFDKIGVAENAKNTTWLQQKSGTCWYKIVSGGKDELFRVSTPLATVSVAGSGADFTISLKGDELEISNMDGLLFLERAGNSEAINLISGQIATIYNDSRPIQVSPLGTDANPADRFSQLTKEKTTFVLQHMPLNFIFCGVPSVFIFGSVQFENKKISLINIPPEMSVEEYVQGCTTLDQAFLYGGGVFTTTILEQIIDTRIPKFIVIEKEDMMRIAGALGGLKIDVDEKAASSMKIGKGIQKLSKLQLALFLKPSLSGTEDFKKRQNKIIRALFEGLTTKNIILTALMAEQIFTNVQTNFTTSQIMDEYTKFTAVKNWSFQENALPVQQNMRSGRVVLDPIREECRKLLQN